MLLPRPPDPAKRGGPTEWKIRSQYCLVHTCIEHTYELITKELIHLFKRTSLCLGVEEPITQAGYHVEHEEDVEVLELERAKRGWRELGEDEIDGPISEGLQDSQ